MRHSIEPEIVEFPFGKLDGTITPNASFYIRNHSTVPSLRRSSYRLRVEGEVDHPLTLDFESIRRMPQISQTVVLECAGNNRGLLSGRRDGPKWALGGVGCALWTG